MAGHPPKTNGIVGFLSSQTIEVVSDTFLLGFGLAFFFPHIQYVYNMGPRPDATVWGLLRVYVRDAKDYPSVYIGFIVIAAGWLVLKILRMRRERREAREAEERDDRRYQELVTALQSFRCKARGSNRWQSRYQTSRRR